MTGPEQITNVQSIVKCYEEQIIKILENRECYPDTIEKVMARRNSEKSKFKRSWEILRIIGIFKTIRFNFKYFNFKTAVKLPVFISRRVKFKSLKGDVVLEGNIRTGMVKFGFGGSGTASYMPIVFENRGTIFMSAGIGLGGAYSFL